VSNFPLTPRHLIQACLGLLLSISPLGWPLSAAPAPKPHPKSVLVISSYRPGYSWSADLNQGLHEVWRDSPLGIETWVDFLDASRNPNWQQHFLDRYNADLRQRNFDLVVLLDDEAVSLWCGPLQLFPDTPIVFGGVTSVPTCKDRRSTGSLENFNINGLVQFGLAVRPAAPEIIVLTDDTALSAFFLDKLRSVLSPDQRQRLIQWNSTAYSLSEIFDKAVALSPDSLVFVAAFHHDKTGTFLPPLTTLRQIGQVSRAPLLALAAEAMPGLLAGSKNTGVIYGRRLALIATQVLAGVSPASIPVRLDPPLPVQLESTELTRWAIPAHLIPPQAEILHPQVSFLSRYRAWIAAALVFVIAQSLLLAILGANILARRRAQVQLRESHSQLERQNEDYRQALAAAAAASESKSRFVANMSHEIRTPLNGILGTSELLLDSSLPAPDRSSIQTIRSSARHLLVILNDILDVSQLESGRLRIVQRPFSPGGLLQEAVQLFRPPASSPLRLLSLIEGALPGYVLGDPARIRQILFNLTGNACKFTEAGEITIGARYKEGNLIYWVRDTGIGIPPDQLASIFSRFAQVDHSSTRRHGGLGLGLFIAKELATAMGASLDAESQPGQGSCFTLTLPAPITEGPPPSAPAPAPTLFLKDRKILVVEDNSVNLTLVKRMLERAGCHVSTASDGAEGVSAARTQPIDLIFMDLQMPQMDGYAATRAIRALDHPNAQVPIIALTASAMAGDRERCLQSGMNDHLSKPIDRRSLEAVLSRWLKPN
jgi:signal transduction histidine kinase